MMDLLSFKVILIIVLMILGFLSVVSPNYFCQGKPFLFSVGNMFSAGVLLSAAIVHSLSDASTSTFYQSYKVPYVNMICGISFLVMLLVEEIGHTAHDSSNSHHHHYLEEGDGDEQNEEFHDKSQSNTTKQGRQVTPESERRGHSHSHGHEHGHNNHSHHDHNHSHGMDKNNDDYGTLKAPILLRLHSSSSSTGGASPHPNRHHHHAKHLEEHLESSMKSVMTLLFALIIHSVILGISIGVADAFSAFLELTLAVLSHKLFAGFALGSTMKAANIENKKRLFSTAAGFAISTPLGIVIGMNMKLNDDTSSVFSGTIKAVVAGLFLYISIIEICMKELLICRENAKKFGIGNETAKLLGIVFGFICMSLLAFWL